MLSDWEGDNRKMLRTGTRELDPATTITTMGGISDEYTCGIFDRLRLNTSPTKSFMLCAKLAQYTCRASSNKSLLVSDIHPVRF